MVKKKNMQTNNEITNSNSLRIIFIAGAGRSGSTLIGDVLGQANKSIHLGELWGIFDYTTVPDGGVFCSCGASYEDCDFWSQTFETLFGEDWLLLFREWNFQKTLPHSTKLLLLMFRNKFWPGNEIPLFDANVKDALKALKRALHFICEREQVGSIIDSSKFGPYAWLLSKEDDMQLVVVHLVRDPRATLYSWVTKPIPMYDRETRQFSLRTRTWIESVVYWVRANFTAIFLRLMGLPYYRLQYETFINEPLSTTRELISFANSHMFDLEMSESLEEQLREKSLRLNTRHLIGSNPDVKRKAGQIEIKSKRNLKDLIGTGRFYLWTLIFLPWLLWLGYPILRQRDE